MSEEREAGRPSRAELQGRILETIESIRQAVDSPPPQAQSLPDTGAVSAGRDAQDVLAIEPDAPVAGPQPAEAAPGVSQEEFESVQSQNLALEQEKEDLQQEDQAVGGQAV